MATKQELQVALFNAASRVVQTRLARITGKMIVDSGEPCIAVSETAWLALQKAVADICDTALRQSDLFT